MFLYAAPIVLHESLGTSELREEIWSESRWLASRDECEILLATSDADPLFLSWDWQTLWWKLLEKRPGERLVVYAFYDQQILVGILPVVEGPVRRRGRFQFRSAQAVGVRLHENRGAMSEYLDVIASRGYESSVRSACVRMALRERSCSELVIGWTPAATSWSQARVQKGVYPDYVRSVDSSTSYQVNLKDGFDAYLRWLGASTRRSMINLRKRLQGHGAVNLEMVPAAEIGATLELMNSLHATRWSAPAFSGLTLRFHRQLTDLWTSVGRIKLSRLRVGGKVVSILYDVRVGSTQYNLQMGFDAHFDPRLSLGLLHLGYAIEHAAGEGVETYDLLAGSGRKTNYKQRIGSLTRDLATIQVLGGVVLPQVYRAYDWLQARRAR